MHALRGRLLYFSIDTLGIGGVIVFVSSHL